MRTTVTLDPDTEQLVRARMKREGVSFKRALNDAIREADRPAEEPFVMKTYDMGPYRFDVTKALQIVGELDDAEILREMQSRP